GRPRAGARRAARSAVRTTAATATTTTGITARSGTSQVTASRGGPSRLPRRARSAGPFAVQAANDLEPEGGGARAVDDAVVEGEREVGGRAERQRAAGGAL